MGLSLAIMTHPSRADMADRLLLKLWEQVQSARVAGHDVDAPTLAIDEDSLGPWTCWRAAWKSRSREHHLIVQDDILPCADFIEAAARVARLWPDRVVGFFCPRTEPAPSPQLVPSSGLLWLQAAMMPVEIGDAVVSWTGTIEKFWEDDAAVNAFLDVNRIKRWVLVPNPVEHVGEDSISHPGTELGWRRSRSFVGEDARVAGLIGLSAAS